MCVDSFVLISSSSHKSTFQSFTNGTHLNKSTLRAVEKIKRNFGSEMIGGLVAVKTPYKASVQINYTNHLESVPTQNPHTFSRRRTSGGVSYYSVASWLRVSWLGCGRCDGVCLLLLTEWLIYWCWPTYYRIKHILNSRRFCLFYFLFL